MTSSSSSSIRKGELVLVLSRPIVVTHKTKGKFEPKWEGPYAIEQVYDRGAYQLADPQGAQPMPPINGRFLKKIFMLKFASSVAFFSFCFLLWGILQTARIHGAFFFALHGYLFSPFSFKQNKMAFPHHTMLVIEDLAAL
jgi:hypothetical protein